MTFRTLLLGLLTVVSVLTGSAQAGAAGPGMTGVAAPAGADLDSHVCRVLGRDTNGYEGIACADLLDRAGGGTVSVIGQDEIYCQDPSNSIVDCAGISESAGVCDTASGQCHVNPGECGAFYGHSDCGARRVINSITEDYSVCSPQSWGAAIFVTIVLPGTYNSVGVEELDSEHGGFCP